MGKGLADRCPKTRSQLPNILEHGHWVAEKIAKNWKMGKEADNEV
jgi:hypothetical protein